MKKRLFIICPGRGSYTKESLNYLAKYNSSQNDFISDIDQQRSRLNLPTITELDSSKSFKTSTHTKGEHASPLIYACSYCDFMSIDRNKYEIVAIAGNSLGWYLSLAIGGSLDWTGAFTVINTMGSMMKDGLIGGQIIYPVINEEWQIDPKKVELINNVIKRVQGDEPSYLSIDLGGYYVLAGSELAIKKLMALLPKSGDYPFKLINHGAFHTPLLHDISTRGFDLINSKLFNKPKVPLIDGRGHIWTPYATDVEELYYYTLGHQVVEPYHFKTSVQVGLKEFNPDYVVLLGPGNSLGGAIGQCMIDINWQNLSSKNDFIQRQKKSPLLLSMGIEEQRSYL